MKVTDLIERLQKLEAEGGGDCEVFVRDLRTASDAYVYVTGAEIDDDADCVLEIDA